MWRSQKGDDGAGLWHLMSGCPSGTEVGVAWTNTICQTNLSGAPGQSVSGTAVTTAGPVEWQVVAHEIGHNFGAIVSTISLFKLSSQGTEFKFFSSMMWV